MLQVEIRPARPSRPIHMCHVWLFEPQPVSYRSSMVPLSNYILNSLSKSMRVATVENNHELKSA